jgi:hypothetical protein
VVAACTAADLLPDGGRPRQNCNDTPTAIGVVVNDAMGMPVSGATVTARNTANGMTQTSTTGGNGHASGFDDSIGDGQIEFTATNGTISSRQPFVVRVVCGECDCTAMPAAATLTLQ